MKIEDLYALYLAHPSVQTDTRKLQQGDIYFALKGENFDGNQFAEQALNAGASYAIIDNVKYQISDRCLLVDDVLQTLQDLALHHRKQFDIPFIAITGSNGKTTTKELVYTVLSSTYKTYATEGNLNNHIGIPLTLLKIKMDAEIAIIEMGANHQHEIESYCLYALPNYALINNCGKAHLEGFGGEEGVRKGKGELFNYIRETKGVIFRNVDLPYLAEMAHNIKDQITYGSNSADYIGKIYANQPFLQVAILNSGQETLIKSNLVGAYNFGNLMAAVAIGMKFEIPMDKIKKSLESYMPSNSRSQMIQQDTNTIILDAYNANPSSMLEAIKNFEQTDYPNKVIMLGAMKELGEESAHEHQQLVELLKQSNWNHVVLVGKEFTSTPHPYIQMNDVGQAAAWYEEQAFENTAFLIKGSRAYTMEKIIQ